jgi:hypothetical protein
MGRGRGVGGAKRYGVEKATGRALVILNGSAFKLLELRKIEQ